jgi:hypothetical protein
MQCKLSSLRWPKVANTLCEGMSQTVVVEDTQILPVNTCLMTCYLPALMLQYSEIKLFHEDIQSHHLQIYSNCKFIYLNLLT